MNYTNLIGNCNGNNILRCIKHSHQGQISAHISTVNWERKVAMATIYCRRKHSHQGQISAQVSAIFYPTVLSQLFLGTTGGNWERMVDLINGNGENKLFFFQVN